MRTLKDWLLAEHSITLDGFVDEDLVASQVDMMVDKLGGLLHGLTPEQKSTMVDRFMRQIEERVLGI